MQKKKYGIWRTRYAINSKNMVEGWLSQNGQPFIFSEELAALKYKKTLEITNHDRNVSYEVRCFT